MLKQVKQHLPLLAIAGVSAMSLGIGAALLNTVGGLDLTGGTQQAQGEARLDGLDPVSDSAVLKLVSQSPEGRGASLMEFAQAGQDGRDRDRARYLLALDFIDQDRGGSAIPLLEGLEDSYEIMTPFIWFKRGQAQRAAGQKDQALATWQQAIAEFPNHPATAEILYELGQQDPQYLDQLLSEIPAHPRSVEVAYARWTEDVNRADAIDVLRIVIRHGRHLPDIESILDRVVEEYASQLQPEDWEAIGFAYWDMQKYGKAGPAYANAPPNALNAYRAARGYQLGKKRDAAIAAYYQLDQQFPEAIETGEGLLKFSWILPDKEAINVLDQVIARFPDWAAEAMMERAERLDNLNSATSAAQARQSILTQYSQSESAAELRLYRAKQAAKVQDWEGAINWAKQATEENSDSDLAAEAAFWWGKWSLQRNDNQTAQTAFETAIAIQPESYYAWRSAVMLGWEVGDFPSIRTVIPEIVLPEARSPLPAGSEALQELYLLGQDRDAWKVWQTEFTGYLSPTVAEQFTDGLMRIGVDDTLRGIFQIETLDWRENPDDRAQYAQLKQQPAYWHALYPFPYTPVIEAWANQRQLNPLLVTALMRQESRFMPKIRSVVGATGLMQVMPSTAEWIDESWEDMGDYSLENPEDNIKFGTWYLNYTHQEFNNNSLFAIASYNAGPGNISEWISEGGFKDADDFVEKIPFPETHGYVHHVFGNYWNYLRLYNPEMAQRVSEYADDHASHLISR
ncbi:MAG: transglycosylase SLT domain-containing protein [Cyanobacteria bacterium P01_A01_bin.123]